MHSVDLKGAIKKKTKNNSNNKKLHRSRDTRMWKCQLTSFINNVFAAIHLLIDLSGLTAWDDVNMRVSKELD